MSYMVKKHSKIVKNLRTRFVQVEPKLITEN